jgi:hypothetical protein
VRRVVLHPGQLVDQLGDPRERPQFCAETMGDRPFTKRSIDQLEVVCTEPWHPTRSTGLSEGR